jgi:cytochrome c oxidase subunit 2
MFEFLDISEYLGMPAAGSAHAPSIDFMMALVHWMMLFLFIGWGTYYIYVLFRFRAAKNPTASYKGAVGKYSKVQEGVVIVAECALLIGFAFPLWGQLKNEFPDADSAFEVHVIAEQFAWNIHYPGEDGYFGRRDIHMIDLSTNPIGLDKSDPAAADDLVMVNELHLPVDQDVIIQLSSKDVIHSFGVPEFRIKQDVMPGLVIPIWFRPTLEGEFEIACAQLCGLSHYRMRGYVTVESSTVVNSWIQEMIDEEAAF